jgi:hypothetical protein
MLRRIDGKWHTEEQLQDPAVLRGFGFSQREIDYIVQHGWTELPLLYLGPYLDAIPDEYQPFVPELAKYDEITASELLIKDGATDAALRFNGLRRGDGSPTARNSEVSALFRIWQTAIVKHRNVRPRPSAFRRIETYIKFRQYSSLFRRFETRMAWQCRRTTAATLRLGFNSDSHQTGSSPVSRANTKMLFAGSVMFAEVGSSSQWGPSAVTPP